MDGTLKLGEQEIARAYDEFVDTVIKICTSKENDVPAYFTIQYTCLEMQQLQTMLNNETLKKSPHPKLHHP